MSHKRTILTFSILLIIAIALIANNQKSEWKGKIEYVDGVKVIKNQEKPLYGEIAFELEKELILGSEGDGDSAFYGIVKIEVDSEGNIYVLIAAECQIHKYDKNGNLVTTFGGKGQGPGEFENPSELQFDSKENLFVKDMFKLHVFDKQGGFKRSFQLENLFGPHRLMLAFESFGIMENGNIMGQCNTFTPESQSTDIVMTDSKGKKIKTLLSTPAQTATPIQGRRIVLYNPYFPFLHFCRLDDDIAVYGNTSEYRLYVTDSSGDTLFIIEKQVAPLPITRKDKDKIIDDKIENVKNLRFGINLSRKEVEDIIGFDKHRPFFDGICSDGSGNIYVMRSKSAADEGKETEFDLFDPEGYYLYNITIPVTPRIITNGYVYSFEDDPNTDYVKVKRYKIKNWKHIKDKRGV